MFGGIAFWYVSAKSTITGGTNTTEPTENVDENISTVIYVEGAKDATDGARVYAFTDDGEWVLCEATGRGMYALPSTDGVVLGLVAASRGYISDPYDYDPAEREVTLRLNPTSHFLVEVEDEDSAPAQRAKLEVGFSDPIEAKLWALISKEFGVVQSVDSLTTNDEGRYRFKFIRVGQVVTLSAISGTRRAAPVQIEAGSETTVRLKLDEEVMTLEYLCVEHTGSPVPGIEVTLATRPTDSPTGEFVFTTESDDQGRAEVKLPKGHVCKVIAVSEGWWINKGARRENRVSDSPVTLLVHREIDLRAHITYDDGVAYHGDALVTAGEKSWFCIYEGDADGSEDEVSGWDAVIDKEGWLTLYGVPRGLAVEFRGSRQHRVEYPKLRVTIGDVDISDQLEVEIVIPRLSTQEMAAQFSLTVTGESSGSELVEIYHPQSGARMDHFALSERRISRMLKSDTYVIRILGEVAWMSQELFLAGGEIRQVEAMLVAAGAVKVKVVGPSGDAIQDAVVMKDSRLHPTYPPNSKDGQIAVSDASGVAILKMQPAAYTEYRVEAQGFQPTTIGVLIPVGDTVEYGEVFLAPAEGEITLVIETAIPGSGKVVVELLAPHGHDGSHVEKRVLNDGQCRFTGLCTGRLYILSAKYTNGGTRASLIINGILLDRTKSKKEFRVTLDQFRYE